MRRLSIGMTSGSQSIRIPIMLFDGAREVLGLGLNSLGYSLNSKDSQQLEETVDKLYKLTPNIKAIVADEMKGYMIQNNAAIGVTFSGEASQMLEKMKTYAMWYRQKPATFGLTIWLFPKQSKTKMQPMLYQFYVETRKCSQKCEYVGYSTPNLPAKELLPEEKKRQGLLSRRWNYETPRSLWGNLTINGRGKYSDLFLQFKMYRSRVSSHENKSVKLVRFLKIKAIFVTVSFSMIVAYFLSPVVY